MAKTSGSHAKDHRFDSQWMQWIFFNLFLCAKICGKVFKLSWNKVLNFQDSKMEETADCGKTLVQEGGMWEDFWYLTLNHYFSYFSIQYLKKNCTHWDSNPRPWVQSPAPYPLGYDACLTGSTESDYPIIRKYVTMSILRSNDDRRNSRFYGPTSWRKYLKARNSEKDLGSNPTFYNI